MGDFVIKLRDLENGEKPYRFELSRAWIERALDGTELSAPTDASSGVANVRALLTGRDVLVRGDIDAHVSTACARCLGPALVHVHADVTAIYSPAPAPPPAPSPTKGAVAVTPVRDGAASSPRARRTASDAAADAEEVELAGDDLDREHYTGEILSLDSLVRDQLLVEVPFNPLCRDDCPGLVPKQPDAPTDSTRDVIDPRFAPLLALKLPNKE